MDRLEAARRVMADHFGVSLEEADDHASFTFDLGADSLDLLELTMRLEDEFSLNIEDDEGETCGTVGEALRLLSRKFQDPLLSTPDASIDGR